MNIHLLPPLLVVDNPPRPVANNVVPDWLSVSEDVLFDLIRHCGRSISLFHTIGSVRPLSDLQRPEQLHDRGWKAILYQWVSKRPPLPPSPGSLILMSSNTFSDCSCRTCMQCNPHDVKSFCDCPASDYCVSDPDDVYSSSLRIRI